MEENIESMNMKISVDDEFHWENLISYAPDITSHRYKAVRDKLMELQEWLYEINNAKYKDEDDSSGDENNRNYESLYEYAKYELISIESNITELLNILVTIYYSDKKFMEKHSDKSILWGCFGDELVERIKCNYCHEGDPEIDCILLDQ